MPPPLYLRARLRDGTADLLAEHELLHGLVRGLGSPLNVLFPREIAGNHRRFRALYDRRRLAGRIYFAHKANRSTALLRELADVPDSGVDVASTGELEHALAAGFPGSRITATGPKDESFLWLAARSDATVAVDSPEELSRLGVLARGPRRIRVLLRLSGFTGHGTKVLTRPSRFGSSPSELGVLCELAERHKDVLELYGVAHHLDTNGLQEKVAALEGSLLALDECRSRGFTPRAVNIGGGFGVGYLADQAEWDAYTSALHEAVLGKRSALTWGGHGYGLRRTGEHTLAGTLGLYPAFRPLAAEGYLDELLSQTAPTLGRPLAALVQDHLYDLHIEPGRALTDQCGLTLMRVEEVRRTVEGRTLVRLAGNARDMSAEDHAVLMDPVLIPARPMETGEPVGVYLTGNLCLEDDLITRRQVFLPGLPAPGDLLAFVNTAGYFMDFRADQALMQPIARKVAVWPAAGGWHWCLDEDYWPFLDSRDPTQEW
jgi:diaminopimelate decarboxylase